MEEGRVKEEWNGSWSERKDEEGGTWRDWQMIYV